MDIKIKNFGPIAEGDISIKPLTIFIGPNNTGKSYAAVLVHCLYSAFNKLLWGTSYRRDRYMQLSKKGGLQDVLEEDDNIKIRINKALEDLKKNNKFEAEIPEDIIVEVYSNLLHRFTDILTEEISRAFASNLKDLTGFNTKSFSLVIKFNGFSIPVEYANNQVNINRKELPIEDIQKEIQKLKTYLKITTQEMHGSAMGWRSGVSERIEIEIDHRFLKSVPHEALVRDIQEAIIQNISQRHLAQMMKKCHYLPAARSGIMQGHKAVSAAIISEAPLAGLTKIEIPTLSGITADFIISLIRLEKIGRGAKLEKVIDFIEEDIIKGKISVQQMKQLYPEFTYDINGMSLPLHRTSSMVSELAPIVLYLRYLVDKGDVLIIEEPEAHLHPGMQRKLARAITLLIRNGVNVFITTHSDYLIEQISNFIQMSELKEKERESLGYTKNDFLKPDEVSVHLFKYSDEKGTITEKLKVSNDGIPQEEFGKIAEELYEEKVKLQRKLGG